jgi:acetyl esterase/lipase
MKRAWLAAGLCLLAMAAAWGQAASVERRSLVYRSVAGADLNVDLVEPSGSPWGRARPVLVMIHGGGWTCGNREAFADAPRRLAQSYGWVVAVPEYRLAPAAEGCPAASRPVAALDSAAHRAAFPAQLDDLQALMLWLRGQASTLQIHPHKIAVLGASAGGQLAGLLGASRRTAAIPGGVIDSRADAVVSVGGPWDLTDASATAHPNAGGMLSNLFGGPPTVAQLRAASPALQWVAGGGGRTPVLFLHGVADPLVPARQSVQACARLPACAGGAPVLIDTPPGADPHDALTVMLAGRERLLSFLAALAAAP